MKIYTWKTLEPKKITQTNDINDVSISKIPILEISFKNYLNREERLNVLKKIKKISFKSYNDVRSYQNVKHIGKTFVDASSLKEYHNIILNREIDNIISYLFGKVSNFLLDSGYFIEILYDDFFKQYYQAGTIRSINVAMDNSVLHIDNYFIDSKNKKDFILPQQLKNKSFTQVSFNILLENNNQDVDNLYIYNKIIDSDSEKYRMQNGWQFPESIVNNSQQVIHTPKIGELYMFNTRRLHDIKGNNNNNNRITFSVFALYDENTKTFYMYN